MYYTVKTPVDFDSFHTLRRFPDTGAGGRGPFVFCPFLLDLFIGTDRGIFHAFYRLVVFFGMFASSAHFFGFFKRGNDLLRFCIVP